MNKNCEIAILYGKKKIVIFPPVLIRKRIRRKWLPDKFKYWVNLEYVKLGPYVDLKFAEEVLAIMNVYK